MSVFYTSDTHFGHTRMIQLADRPFSSTDEMNQAMIDNWNKVVTRADDIVWHLGDLASEGSWKIGLECARQLNGRKFLIEGNHDMCWTGKSESRKYRRMYEEIFEVVLPWSRVPIGGYKYMLSHFPYYGDHTEDQRYGEYRLREGDKPLVHGHTHLKDKFSFSLNGLIQIHVGVEAWDFTPVKDTQILETWKEARAIQKAKVSMWPPEPTKWMPLAV